MLKSLGVIVFLFSISSEAMAASDYEPMKINCDKDSYVIYWGATGYAVTENGQLLTKPEFVRKTYGDDPDATILTVEHWGRNGGMHYLKTFIFSGDRKRTSLLSQYLDADNTPRSAPELKNCTSTVNVDVFFQED